MLRTIRNFFEQRIQAAAEGREEEARQALHLATAVLFVELGRADFDVGAQERQVARQALAQVLDLDPDSAAQLLAQAEAEADEAVSLFEFTDLIHRSCTPEQKLEIVGLLWQLAFADGHLDVHEEHMMRKVKRLLHIPHKDYVEVKKRARAAAEEGG